MGDGWTAGTVGDIADPSPGSISIGPFGSSLRAELYSDSGVPVLRGQNLGDGRALDEADLVFVPDEVAAGLRRSMVDDGDLVFPHRGAIGRVGLVSGRRYLLSSSMMKLTVDVRKHDPRFFFYYFKGPGRHELLVRASTVGTPGIGQPLTSLRSIPVRYPGLPEQRAIAEVLGALDDKIAGNDRLADTADTLAWSLFDAAASSASRIRMSDRLRPVLGATPSRSVAEYWAGELPWASARDVAAAPHAVVFETAESISPHATEMTRARALPTGSVILTARGTVGAVARLGVPAAFNQSCYGFVPGDLPPAVLFFIVRYAAARTRELAHGSVFDTITAKTFDHLEVPDFDHTVLLGLEAELGPVLAVIDAHEREKRALVATRDALLPALMSGALQVERAEQLAEDLS